MIFKFKVALFTVALLSACSDSNVTIGNGANNNESAAPEAPSNQNPSTTPDANVSANSATYSLRFEATWSRASHSLGFPDNPHFSGLIGAVHNEQVIFWEAGQIATRGIKLMAETGGKTELQPEINAAINSGSALSLIDEGGIDPAPGSRSIEFTVTQDYPQISLVSMLAPSPDWFVGVHNVDLRDGNGFISSLNIELPLYDAGTDNGTNYVSADNAAIPQSPIAQVSGDGTVVPFINGLPVVGRFVISRTSP